MFQMITTSEFQFHNSKKVCFMNNIKNIQEVTGHDEEAMLRLSRGMCIHEVQYIKTPNRLNALYIIYKNSVRHRLVSYFDTFQTSKFFWNVSHFKLSLFLFQFFKIDAQNVQDFFVQKRIRKIFVFNMKQILVLSYKK